jgi:Lon protease-like protein
MSDTSAEPPVGNRPHLPAHLPIFPLEGAMLLPHGHLPLHVFEPRYRALVEAALGSGRVLGMIQPRLDYRHPLPDDAELFEVGCAGRIVSFAETDDGRFLVTLRGVCRFRIGQDLGLTDAGFRRVRPDFAEFAIDLEPPEEVTIDRERLLEAAKLYLQVKEIACDWTQVEQASLPALVTSLAMICPFAPGEKQALLETPTLTERGRLLISLLDMAALSSEAAASNTRH